MEPHLCVSRDDDEAKKIDRSSFQGGVNGTSLETELEVGLFQITPTFKFFKDFEAGSLVWRPYGVLGGGLYHSIRRTRSVGTTGIKSDLGFDTDYGVNIGAGVRLFLSERFGFGTEARFHSVGDRNKRPFQAIVITGGILFGF